MMIWYRNLLHTHGRYCYRIWGKDRPTLIIPQHVRLMKCTVTRIYSNEALSKWSFTLILKINADKSFTRGEMNEQYAYFTQLYTILLQEKFSNCWKLASLRWDSDLAGGRSPQTPIIRMFTINQVINRELWASVRVSCSPYCEFWTLSQLC